MDNKTHMPRIAKQLLTFKYTFRDPHATENEIDNAYDTVKNLIDETVEEDYIKNIFYERFLKLKTYYQIGMACHGLSDECVRKIIERYIKKIERRLTNESTKI